MKKSSTYKLEAITPGTLIIGVDIAKKLQWARFTDYRGLEIGKAIKFRNDKNGFETILTSIKTVCKLKKLDHAIVGWSPPDITGSP